MSNCVSEFIPSCYPPFPEGLSTIKLETISLSKLENQQPTEQARLFEICQNKGFFYLNLDGSTAATLQRHSEEIVRLSEEVFKLPIEEKESYLPQEGDPLFGYKNVGRTVTDEVGTPDTAEFFNISKNDMVSEHLSLQWPKLIVDQRDLLRDFVVSVHETGLFILRVLNQKLKLPPDTFANLHRIQEQSCDHIRMTRGPPRRSTDMPEIQTPGHTDFGTITILFNWLGGLQIWSKGSRGTSGFTNVVDPDDTEAEWLWVIPKPGHAIINLGDAAVKFTNGLLCSGRHRVVPAPGEQGQFPRYSLAYFVRPEDEAILKCLESPGIIQPPIQEEEITAIEWIARQAKALTGTQKN